MFEHSCFLELFFSWEVLGIAVGVLLTVGFALLGDELKMFNAAIACFTMAGVLSFGKVVMWATFDADAPGVRVGVVAGTAALIGTGMVELLRLSWRRQRLLEHLGEPGHTGARALHSDKRRHRRTVRDNKDARD
jgi:hypothetical protein